MPTKPSSAGKPTGKKKLTTKGSQTPPEVQAAVMAALLSGQFNTLEDVAVATGTSGSTVSRIQKNIPPEYLAKVEESKKDKIGELVAQHLEHNLTALIAIDTFIINNPEWLLAKDAAQVATLYGVKSDKAIRILEAAERANRVPEPEIIPAHEG